MQLLVFLQNDIPQTEEELWKQLKEIEELAKSNKNDCCNR